MVSQGADLLRGARIPGGGPRKGPSRHEDRDPGTFREWPGSGVR